MMELIINTATINQHFNHRKHIHNNNQYRLAYKWLVGTSIIFITVGLYIFFTRIDRDFDYTLQFITAISTSLVAPVCAHEHTTTPPMRVVHFVYPIADEMQFFQYVALYAARKYLQPHILYLHIPDSVTVESFESHAGRWWMKAKSTLNITLHQVQTPSDIFGRVVDHPAHKSDIVRLQSLIQHAGLYLDLDMVMIRELPDEMWYAPLSTPSYQHTVLDSTVPCARLTMPNEHDFLDYQKLSNAFMMATAPNNPFLIHWLNQYNTFDDSDYMHHGVEVPAALAATNEWRDHINILPPSFALRPKTYNLYQRSGYDFAAAGHYAVHLWHSMTTDRLINLKDCTVFNTYREIVAHVLEDNHDDDIPCVNGFT